MQNIYCQKYLIIPGSKMRIWEFILKFLAISTVIALGVYSDFVYKQTFFAGMSSITPVHSKTLVGIKYGKNFAADPADYFPNPPSDTAVVLKRLKKTYQRLKFCNRYDVCDESCVNFRKVGMRPNWCADPQFLEDVSFTNIENLDLKFRSTFAGELPKMLFKKELVEHVHSISQILSRLTSVPDKGHLDTIVLRYFFKCVQRWTFRYDCIRDLLVHRIKKNFNSKPGAIQKLSEDKRLKSEFYGYSFRSSASLEMKSFGYSNLIILSLLAYYSALLVQRFLAWFFLSYNKNDALINQLRFELDLSRHLKED